MDRKVSDYFAAGVQRVWLIDPARRTAKVYSGVGAFQELQEGDELDGAPVLPGFRLPLAALFAELKRPPRP